MEIGDANAQAIQKAIVSNVFHRAITHSHARLPTARLEKNLSDELLGPSFEFLGTNMIVRKT